MKNKNIARLVFFIEFLLAFDIGYTQTRIASFGSNPEFSYSLYPQDISNQHSNALIFFPSYSKSPWWGDIDQITNKPSGAVYTITGTEISESPAYFKESAKLHTSRNVFGYSYRPSEKFTARVDFDYTLNALRDRAEGNFTNVVSTDTSYVPFDYSLRHTLNSFLVDGLFGFSLFDVPFGIKLRAGLETTLALKSDFSFTKYDTIDVSTSRVLWGWSNVGCAHIFGVRNPSPLGDAWLQNEYSKGPLYTLEFTAGTSLDRIKAGMSLMLNFGRQDFYRWRYETDTAKLTGDTIVDRNFIGEYDKSDWTKKSHQGQINLYGNIHWLTGDRFGLNSFVRAGYKGNVTGDVLSSNPEVESDSKETRRGFLIEADPNINIKLGPWLHYIDIGLLLQYEYYRTNNTHLRGVGGGRTKAYINSAIVDLDEVAWEDFSYANQNIFNAGMDLSAMFPLFDNNFGRLGFGLIILGNVKADFQTKYYGEIPENSSENNFQVKNRRENLTREVSFSTVLMLNYIKDRYNIRLETTSPLLSSQMTRTRITDANGKNAGPYHRKDPLWLSQKGLQVGVFITYDFQFSFLKYKLNNYRL